jgi:hypothetical protein
LLAASVTESFSLTDVKLQEDLIPRKRRRGGCHNARGEKSSYPCLFWGGEGYGAIYSGSGKNVVGSPNDVGEERGTPVTGPHFKETFQNGFLA